MKNSVMHAKHLLHTTLASFAIWTLCALPASSAATSDLDEVLNSARSAARRDVWTQLGGDLVLSGPALIIGINCTFELTLSAGGAFRNEISGPLGATLAFDGSSGWRQPINGPAGALGREELESSLLNQWVISGYWLEPDALLEIHMLEEDSEEVLLRLAFAESNTDVTLVLDRTTWLPSELWQGEGDREVRTTYGEYSDERGLQIPHYIVTQTYGVEEHVSVRKVEIASTEEGARAERYTMPAEAPNDTRFVPELEGEIEMRRVRSGHLMVRPLIDGQDIGWFILDTGAGKTCIDARAADKLELHQFGSQPATGVAGMVIASYRQGKTFELGPFVMQDPVYLNLELAFLEPALGLPVAGIVGHDFFSRSVVELDIEGERVAIFDPATYALEQGVWSEMTIENRLPTVRCTFEGDRSGLFKIDTGDAGSVSFHAPAVESLGLLEGRKVQATQVGGVGGMTSAKAGRLDWFELGGRRFENVNTIFSINMVGVHAGKGALGTLGSTLLKPFQIVFDYPSRRISFGPRLGI